MDNIVNKIAVLCAAVTGYAQAARDFVASTKGKVILAVVLLAVVAAFAHHSGASDKSDLKAQVADLQKQISTFKCPAVTVREPIEDVESKRRADQLAERLSESEAAKARLQQKVTDYEKQLAQRRKAGALILSPADARSLSNIQ
ncbi:hypothetical protein [Bradyrhizobium ottawaense]|uniref:Uncharacterized protein n=1 Tax=Bradyrhizobium ottawaense TaxID=931866 RepID=A0ABY0QH79_9BRAD|nr:hypothetical protein [Bradyrhizobium ottawaense]SDK39644.1 hypothetical protein SAMN05444163_8015 [Bradyrhizobium ottawaense]